MSSKVLLFSGGLSPDQKARLAERHQLADYSGCDTPEREPGFAEDLAQAAGVIGTDMRWDAGRLASAGKLQVVSSISVGVDNYDVDYLNAHGIWLGHTPDVLTETTADTALALMLATARRVVELANRVRAGEWQDSIGPEWYGIDIHHKRLGVVGMGRIGAAIARRARFGFGMRVAYHNRSQAPDLEAELDARYLDFDTLLAESDFICVTVPLSAETENLFDAAAFERMQAHTIFVNISRGAVVDEAALVAALENGEIRGAGLDVFRGEPIDSDNPLAQLDNVVACPHIGSATHETRNAMAELAVDNLIAALDGNTPPAAYNATSLHSRNPR